MNASGWLRRTVDLGIARIARAPDPPWWGAALLGFGCALVMLTVRIALDELHGSATGFMILLPAVMVAALAGGLRSGMVALMACLVGGWTILHFGAIGLDFQSPQARASSVNFTLVGTFASLMSASLRSTVRRLDASLRKLDVTSDEAQAAEAARRDSQAQLRAMIDQASAGIARVDLDGKVVSANARFADMLGLSPAAVIGIRTADVSHPDDVRPTLELLAAAAAGATAGQIEKRYLRPDGSVVWGLTSLAPLTTEEGATEGYIAVIVDITDAKTAESALRESESRFRLMADTAPSPVWLTNEAGEVEFVNAALETFYGRPAEEILGHVWKAAIHPDDVASVAEAQAAGRPSFQPYAFECRFHRADGAWRWMRVTVSPRFVEGVFRGYVGLSFDVTASREALDALAVTERRQTFLLDLSDRIRDMAEPVAIMQEATRALAQKLNVNRAVFGEFDPAAGVYRVQAEWTEGVSVGVGEWPIDRFAPVHAVLASGETVATTDVQTDPVTAPSQAIHDEIAERAFVATPLMKAGRLSAYLGVSASEPRDWTPSDIRLVEAVAERTWSEVERARAQAEVVESEARFRAIADTAPVLIWVTGPDRTRAFVNQAYVAYYGSTYEEALTAAWQDVLHPDDFERIVRESLAGEATGEPFSLEARYRRHDGEYRWLKSFSRPRLDPRGRVVGFVGVAFDISDARRAETDLKRINELLEERVGEALAEKEKAEANLMHAQRMEAVGRLTGGVAHDFNNLLTVVIGALDMILKAPENTARLTKLGTAALAAARRGEGLTHQLLAFSRRQALRPEAVDLNHLIRDGEPLLKRAVGDTIAFETRFRRGGARVRVDVGQFEAALLNLLVNARDAVADRKHGRITVKTHSCVMKAGAVPDLPAGPYVCVSVLDNGSGMDAATRARVFEPFFTTKPVGKGTGLGLSQVYGFARQSGGGVEIRSTVGKGTEIRLYLPPLDGPDAAAPRSAEPDAADLKGLSILVVEDDVQVAEMAMAQLAGLGLKAALAATGDEALAVLARRRFDLMMSDVVMPGGMTGIELARICAGRWPEMKILLTSGYAGEDVDAALADAPWRLLPKPYSGDQLRQALGREVSSAG
ncbi:MAG: PAS domain S-box protein [Brevundimonas sp.]|uniref:PAS domain S-box protein n=1 Tax=Brevundimonas sp. TaxID=1871086 RepID=UPI0040337089